MDEFNNIPTVHQPKNININLYKHQLATIFNMELLEQNNIINISNNEFKDTKMGVIADISGYGKSLSVLGLISRDKMTWDCEVPFVFEKVKIQAEGRVKSYEIKRYNKIPANLILISQTILGQWEQELKKTDLKYTSIKNKQDLTELQAENHDIVLVIPTMYNKLVTVYSNCAWKRFVFDEPGNMKVSGMLEIQAGFYWFLTATPMQIFFHHYRCKGSFMRDIIGTSYSEFEALFKTIIIKNNPDFIKASFEMPKTYHYYYKCFQPIYNLVHNYVNENIKHMIETGNIEGAIISLGGDRTSNIVDLILQKKKSELLELDMKIQIYTLRDDENKITELENKKIRINNQINELDTKFKDMLKNPCNICCEPLKSPVLEINCQNLFCGECLLTWLQRKNTCPLCRIDVDTTKLIYIQTEIHDKNDITITEEKNMTKLEKIVDIISNNSEGKFLIFSDHDGSFLTINRVLKENNITCVQIKGNIKKTEKNLDSFKNGDTQVIFLNSKFNGAGINLQEATDIILYHEMNFDIEVQILGRANRIGRKTHLNVHHLQVKS